MSLEKRKAVYALCKKHGVPILEDNPYGELRFTGQDLPPIKHFDDEGLVVYAASMSKIFAPGMRVALCAAQADVINRLTVAKQGSDVHTNLWSQRVIEQFFEKYDFDAHIEKLRRVYREKATHLMDAITAKLGGAVRFVPIEGGMFLWLTLPDAVDTGTFVKRCLERRVALVPGSAFYVDDAAPCQSVRLNFTTPTSAQIDTGVAIMAEELGALMNA
jgi:2-aminoadipate transaminase